MSTEAKIKWEAAAIPAEVESALRLQKSRLPYRIAYAFIDADNVLNVASVATRRAPNQLARSGVKVWTL